MQGEALVALRSCGSRAQIDWTACYFDRPRPAWIRAVGFKTKLADVIDLPEMRWLLSNLRVRVVRLGRRDLLRQAVSWIRADELYAARGMHNIAEGEDGLTATAICSATLLDRMRLLERGAAGLNDFVSSLDTDIIRLDYEDLLDDLDGTWKALLSFLNLPSGPFVSGVGKNTPDRLDIAVSNFDEIRRALALEAVDRALVARK